MACRATCTLPEGVERFDQHGFAVFNDSTFCDSERHHSPNILPRSSPAIVAAWQDVLSDWSWTQTRGGGKLRSLLKKGVPPSLRQQLWLNLLGCRQLKDSSKFNYKASVKLIRGELVDIGISEYCLKDSPVDWSSFMESETGFPVPAQVIRQITVDVDRTFPGHRLFMEGSHVAKEGRASLFRLLAVYAFYNPTVAYCQGMSYIAGMLLMQMSDEEEAFWAMVALFEKPKYLAGYFDQSLLRIQQHAVVFQKLIAHRLPKFANHLTSIDLHLLTFVTPWFMCLYTSLPCWHTVLTIWDLILLDGISTIFRVALAILRLSQDELLQTSDISKILPRLLHPPPELVSPEILLPIVWRTTVDKWEIDALQAVVREESDPRPGRKRRRRVDSDAGDSDVVGKRPRTTESHEEIETTVFQRVLSLFRSSNQRAQRGPSTRSQAARMRTASRAGQARRKPGAAKACSHSKPATSSQAPRSDQRPSHKASHAANRAPDEMMNPLGPVPVADASKTASRSTAKTKAPDTMSRATGLAASVKWSKLSMSPAGSWTSPWREGLKALTFTLPVPEGVMIFAPENGQNSSTSKEQSLSNLPDKSKSASSDRLKTAFRLDDNNTTAAAVMEQDCQQTANHRKVSPCVMATEGECLDCMLQLDATTAKAARPDAVKGVRFSARPSEGRHPLDRVDNLTPLNTPSNRRIISRSAKVQHSFKAFHTPTALPRSQVCRVVCSPQFSSPEVELQPMNLNHSASKDAQDYL